MKSALRLTALLLLVAAPPGHLAAAPPAWISTLNYQGQLTDSAGQAVADAAYTITFRIYDSAGGPALLWGPETQSLNTSKGLFNVILGQVVPMNLSGAQLNGDAWLTIQVTGDPEMSPRQQLQASMFSQNAWRLQGKLPDNTANNLVVLDATGKIPPGLVGGGSASVPFDVVGLGGIYAIRGYNQSGGASAYGVMGQGQGAGLYGTADTSAAYGVSGSTFSADNAAAIGVYGRGANLGYGVVGASNNGVGVSASSQSLAQPALVAVGARYGASVQTNDAAAGVALEAVGPGSALARLVDRVNNTQVYGKANAVNIIGVWGDNTNTSAGATGVYGTGNYAVYGNSSQANGRGVYGNSTGAGGTGVYGASSISGGYGVAGYHTGLGTAVYGNTAATSTSFAAVHGFNSGSTGLGVFGQHGGAGAGYGVYGSSIGAGGRGVYGLSNQITGYGVQGENNSTTGSGVYGFHSGSGVGNGVYGFSAAAGGRGVFGQTNGSGARGVFGQATNANGYGVYGQADGVNGIGGYFLATNASGSYGVYAQNNAPGGAGIYGYGDFQGVYGYGLMGVYGYTDMDNGYGLISETEGSNDIAVAGFNYGGVGDAPGVLGTSNGATGVGVKGIAYNNVPAARGVHGEGYYNGGYFYASRTTGTTYGTYSVANMANGSGTGVYGSGYSYGLFGNAASYGVWGSGISFGVYGTATSYGVYGVATGTAGVRGDFQGAGTGYGGYFTTSSSSPSGRAVYGQSDGATGYGAYFIANSATGPNIGVLARGSGGGLTYGVLGQATSASNLGAGVMGDNSSTVTSSAGVWGSGYIGVKAEGSNYGVKVEPLSVAGTGYGYYYNSAPAVTYSQYGVYSRSSCFNCTAGYFENLSVSAGVGGFAIQMRGRVYNPDITGTFTVPAASTTYTVTTSYIDSGDEVFLTAKTDPGNSPRLWVTVATGSFTLNYSAAITNATTYSYYISGD